MEDENGSDNVLVDEVALSDAPEVVRDLAAACVTAVERAVGVALDYTQDTLPILDHYFRTMEVGEGEDDEVLSLMAPICGAYFGEVVRRDLGMEWHVPSDEYLGWRLEHRGCFLWFNPIGAAIEGLVNGEAAGWNGHLHMLDRDKETVRGALDGLGDVRAEDYFRLAVRYEVLQTAIESMMRAAPRDKPSAFASDVYAATIATEAAREGATEA